MFNTGSTKGTPEDGVPSFRPYCSHCGRGEKTLLDRIADELHTVLAGKSTRPEVVLVSEVDYRKLIRELPTPSIDYALLYGGFLKILGLTVYPSSQVRLGDFRIV